MAEASGAAPDERTWARTRGLSRQARTRAFGLAVFEAETEPSFVPPAEVLVAHRIPARSDRTPGAVARARRHSLRRLLVADSAGLAVAALLGPLLLSAISTNPASGASRSAKLFLFDLAVIPLFVAVFGVYGLYRGVSRRVSTSVFADLGRIVHALLISGFLYAIVAYVARKSFGFEELSVAKIASMCIAAFVTVAAARAMAFGPLGRSALGSVPVIVVGTGKLAQTVASHLRAQPNVRFVGYVDDNPIGGNDLIGSLDDLPDLCHRYQVARVVVCFSRTHPEQTIEMLKSLAGEVSVSIVPRYYELITARSHVEDLSGLTMLDIAPASLSAAARFFKRLFDIVVSSVVLVVASPALAVIAILIMCTSAGPVLFRQRRAGRNERAFSVMKFRTMYVDAEDRRRELDQLNEVDGPLFKLRDDPRVTRVGRILRKASLDEFPQLINVWKGDMSLVGPRPFVVAEELGTELVPSLSVMSPASAHQSAH